MNTKKALKGGEGNAEVWKLKEQLCLLHSLHWPMLSIACFGEFQEACKKQK